VEVVVSVWNGTVAPAPILAGTEGELVSVRITTDPRHLEELLECLASLSFPINPELFHGLPTVVEFPAYEAWLPSVKKALHAEGFNPASLEVNRMVERLSG
jgi:hypothetical protein